MPASNESSVPRRRPPDPPSVWPRNAPSYFHVMAKPTGAICNLDCKYCFFLSKEALYPDSSFRMSDDVLENYIRQVIESQRSPHVTIAWQGGEPTLMGLPFFRRAMELVKKHLRPGMTIEHTIQTNGTRLDEAWCRFLRDNHFLVGLSMDGPRRLHDAYRVDKAGRPTFDRVMRAAKLMQRHGVPFNILCTVHAANADHPLAVYRFFRDQLKAEFIQFIPIIERVTPQTRAVADDGWGDRPQGRPLYTQDGELVTARSVGPEQWGRFLMAVFDEWVRKDVGRVFIQLFESALAAWCGLPPTMCVFAETCGKALALEHNGDLYCCDHFVEPGYRLGNITETHMVDLVASERQRAFGEAKRDTLPRVCLECPVKFACNGECPRNRFMRSPDGEPGLNYLCAGYKAFFTHINPPMRLMAALLARGRDPAEAMRLQAMPARPSSSGATS
ncbi:MAG TPA: anaerobic sulfatase maturase [Pantanalinema sp.]